MVKAVRVLAYFAFMLTLMGMILAAGAHDWILFGLILAMGSTALVGMGMYLNGR